VIGDIKTTKANIRCFKIVKV